MKNAWIFVVLGFGAMVGWMAPSGSDGTAPSGTFSFNSDPGAVAQQRNLAVAQEQQLNGGEIVLPRDEDGHFYADVTIDGTTSRMLIDTGATVVALTGADAEAMGIYWDQAAVEPVARGASGPVYGVPVKLTNVQLGELEASNVEAIVVPEGLGVSLLGQSFLSRIGRVEMDERRMVLGG